MGREALNAQMDMVKATYHGESLKFICLNARSMKYMFLELEAVIINGGHDIVEIIGTGLGEEDGGECNRMG